MLNKGVESVPPLPIPLTNQPTTLPQKSPRHTKSDLIVLASSKLLRGSDCKKIKGLEETVGMMNADFATMKRAKEESKLKLDQRFFELQKQLEGTKVFVESESKRLGETFDSFQVKFGTDLEKLKKGSSDVQNELAVNLEKKFLEVTSKCQEIEKIIGKEKEERATFVDTALKPLLVRIDNLEKGLELEKDLRKQKEKDLAKKLAEENSRVSEKFETEKLQRMAQLKELNTTFKADIKQQQTMTQDLNTQVKQELKQIASNIEREMDNRFEQQDKIVDNLTQMIKTFQATLRVISDEM